MMTTKTPLAKSIDLIWITVKDLDKAVHFYTEVLGFALTSMSKEYRWAEVKGESGTTLGLAEENHEFQLAAGSNAIITITVENLEAAKAELIEKGARLQGETQIVPDECAMQSVLDTDGNLFQIVEMFR